MRVRERETSTGKACSTLAHTRQSKAINHVNIVVGSFLSLFFLPRGSQSHTHSLWTHIHPHHSSSCLLLPASSPCPLPADQSQSDRVSTRHASGRMRGAEIRDRGGRSIHGPRRERRAFRQQHTSLLSLSLQSLSHCVIFFSSSSPSPPLLIASFFSLNVMFTSLPTQGDRKDGKRLFIPADNGNDEQQCN